MHSNPGNLNQKFAGYSGFILDIEGVLIRGDRVIEPAIAAIDTLKRWGKVVFLSNISDLSRQEVGQKLLRMGFNIGTDEIVTANFATIQYLKKEFPNKNKCLLIGTDSFAEEMEQAGFELVDYNNNNADFVVIGLDYDLTYDKICAAAATIKNGARFIATNIAKIKLKSGGYTIGPGFTVKGLEFVTGHMAKIIGKPSPAIFQYCADKLGLPSDRILTIGDKLEQDIIGGKSIGSATCLVLSGASNRSEAENCHPERQPDFIIDHLGKLIS